MGITALLSLEDATRNLSPNIYSVILHKSLVPQDLLVTIAKPSRLMIGVSSLQKMSLLMQQIIRAIAPISLLFIIGTTLRKLDIPIAYPAASLSSSLSQIRHAYTAFLGFREIYILEVPHFALISKIKML